MTSGVCILLFATAKEVQQLSGSVNHSLSTCTCSYSSIALLVHMGCFHGRFPLCDLSM